MSRWQRLAGFGLIVVGFFLVSSFIKPYVYYAFGPSPSEAGPVSIRSPDRLIIPTIKLSAPLKEELEDMKYSVVRYTSSAIPGTEGNVVITGHNTGGHISNSLFALLHLAEKGDRVLINYAGFQYKYRVKSKTVVKPAGTRKFFKKTDDRRLTLITCYPPATKAKRLVVVAEQVGK